MVSPHELNGAGTGVNSDTNQINVKLNTNKRKYVTYIYDMTVQSNFVDGNVMHSVALYWKQIGQG
jgi:hypothetical protein